MPPKKPDDKKDTAGGPVSPTAAEMLRRTQAPHFTIPPSEREPPVGGRWEESSARFAREQILEERQQKEKEIQDKYDKRKQAANPHRRAGEMKARAFGPQETGEEVAEREREERQAKKKLPPKPQAEVFAGLLAETETDVRDALQRDADRRAAEAAYNSRVARPPRPYHPAAGSFRGVDEYDPTRPFIGHHDTGRHETLRWCSRCTRDWICERHCRRCTRNRDCEQHCRWCNRHGPCERHCRRCTRYELCERHCRRCSANRRCEYHGGAPRRTVDINICSCALRRMELRWSLDDPVNTRRTWELRLRDMLPPDETRLDHDKKCTDVYVSAFRVGKLADRLLEEFEKENRWIKALGRTHSRIPAWWRPLGASRRRITEEIQLLSRSLEQRIRREFNEAQRLREEEEERSSQVEKKEKEDRKRAERREAREAKKRQQEEQKKKDEEQRKGKEEEAGKKQQREDDREDGEILTADENTSSPATETTSPKRKRSVSSSSPSTPSKCSRKSASPEPVAVASASAASASPVHETTSPKRKPSETSPSSSASSKCSRKSASPGPVAAPPAVDPASPEPEATSPKRKRSGSSASTSSSKRARTASASPAPEITTSPKPSPAASPKTVASEQATEETLRPAAAVSRSSSPDNLRSSTRSSSSSRKSVHFTPEVEAAPESDRPRLRSLPDAYQFAQETVKVEEEEVVVEAVETSEKVVEEVASESDEEDEEGTNMKDHSEHGEGSPVAEATEDQSSSEDNSLFGDDDDDDSVFGDGE